MPKFLVLYRSSASARDQMANATSEQAKAGMDAWMNWAERSSDAIVDLGAPLGEAERVGSGAPSSPELQISGFSVVQADSREDAARLFDDHPHLHMPGESSIEVRELLSPPGM